GEGRLRESTLPLFASVVALVTRCRDEEGTDTLVPPTVTAAALWSNLHGIAQLWSWGSLKLALDAAEPEPESGTADALDRLVTAALDAHLGPRS
ncbi:TetR/AcrR family transcriptional regulator, partial [Streptomyces sp. YC537]|nr:TetR/AcrR family transcriptional regulator [Streptomyces boluensis]